MDALDAVLAEARDLGFLGPGPVATQRAHADAFVGQVPDWPPLAVDLGTGGGVPGLVLALASTSRWLLVEAMARRAAFLQAAIVRLRLVERVTVLHGRAETVVTDHRGTAGLVVARSFGPPAVTAELAAPFLQVGGLLVVSEPPGGGTGRWNAAALATLGLVADGVTPGPPAFARFRQARPAPDDVPRPVGRAAKRPIW